MVCTVFLLVFFVALVLGCHSETTIWLWVSFSFCITPAAEKPKIKTFIHVVFPWIICLHCFSDHTLPFSSSPVLPVYLTINARTRLDWRPFCSPQTWWEWCTPCIASCFTVLRQSRPPGVRSPTAPGSSRWLCKGSASSTVLPCSTYLPSRYSW